MKKIIFLVTALIIVIGSFGKAAAQNWQVTNNYSVQFSLDQASGIFKDVKATIAFDEQNLAGARFNVNIDVNSINTGNALMNKHAKSDEWLDGIKYPAITFASKKITKNGAAFQVSGDLTLHGVTKEVSIPFAFKKTGNSGSFTANFNINRNDYKIGKPGGEVDENIKINISVPVNKS